MGNRRVAAGVIVIAALAVPALALAANGETVDDNGTHIVYTGPATGDASAKFELVSVVLPGPLFTTRIQVTSLTDVTTSDPDCEETDDNVIQCNNFSRNFSAVTRGGDDVIDVAPQGGFSGTRKLLARTGDGADTVNGGSGADDIGGEAGSDTLTGNSGADTIDGNEGNDLLLGRTGNDKLFGSAGDDTLLGDDGDDELDGGDGSDRLSGGLGNDQLRGGNGRDVLQGDAGADKFEGGDGFDEADYSDRDASVSLTITIDGQANDGEANEGDDVTDQIDDVRGGDGADRITGNGNSNTLSGGAGNDTLEGTGGLDFYDGGTGDDIINARDGVAERIDCGDGGGDTANTDEFDIVSGCETNNASRELQADVDADGVIAPTDCNDRNPAIKPGAEDIRNNGVDEDCSGADLPAERLEPAVRNRFETFPNGTRVAVLQVRTVPAGVTLELRCTSKSCPFKKKTFKFATATSSKSYVSLFKKRRLRAPGMIEVRFIKPGAIGKVTRFTLRKGKAQTTKTYCTPINSRALNTKC